MPSRKELRTNVSEFEEKREEVQKKERETLFKKISEEALQKASRGFKSINIYVNVGTESSDYFSSYIYIEEFMNNTSSLVMTCQDFLEMLRETFPDSNITSTSYPFKHQTVVTIDWS